MQVLIEVIKLITSLHFLFQILGHEFVYRFGKYTPMPKH